MKSLFLLILALPVSYCFAQQKEAKSSNFFFTSGYGLAGSFFVRSYEESLPFANAGYKSFFKKNFVGNAQNIAVGLHLKNNFDLKVGLHYQHFTRHIKANDTLSGH